MPKRSSKGEKAPQGPTLNPEYNSVYQVWANIGYSEKPVCENCDCDLTGKNIIETPTTWLCQKCYDQEQEDPIVVSVDEREDFHSDV